MNRIITGWLAFAALAVLVLQPSTARAQTAGFKPSSIGSNGVIYVDSHNTIYDHSDGTLFAAVPLPAGATALQFRATGGVITDGSDQLGSADGLYANGQTPYNFSDTPLGDTSWGSQTYQGVSIGATTGIDPALFGVFFSYSFAGTPSNSLDFRSDSGITPDPRTLLSNAPSLNQPFWIGDGFTSNNAFTTASDTNIPPGEIQTFSIPAGATYLLLGIAADDRMDDNQDAAGDVTGFLVHVFDNSTNSTSPTNSTQTPGFKPSSIGSNGVLYVDSHNTIYDNSDGTLFEAEALPAAATALQFRATGGVITDGTDQLGSADGLYANGQTPYNFTDTPLADTSWGSQTYQGVSIGSTTGIDPALFGVFFSYSFAGTPSNSLNFCSDSGITPDPRTLLSNAPSLNQPFWIGDGFTSNNAFTTASDSYIPPGEIQTFAIPAGATHLLLGIAADDRMDDNQDDAGDVTGFLVHVFDNAPPLLNIVLSGNAVVLSWPTNSTGFTLQCATNLANTAVWSTNLPAPVVVNEENTVTNAISGTEMFYRLSN